jgi:hypothetical protein
MRGLIHAYMKIDAQEAEISTFKDLHRSYGQKVKQVENKYVTAFIARTMMGFWMTSGRRFSRTWHQRDTHQS